MLASPAPVFIAWKNGDRTKNKTNIMQTRNTIALTLALTALWIFNTPAARADLLVLAHNPAVWRFDDHTGALIGHFGGGGAETFDGMGLGPDGRVYVTGNVLGYANIYYYDRLGQFLGKFGNNQESGNFAFAPNGTGYVIGGGGIFR